MTITLTNFLIFLSPVAGQLSIHDAREINDKFSDPDAPVSFPTLTTRRAKYFKPPIEASRLPSISLSWYHTE